MRPLILSAVLPLALLAVGGCFHADPIDDLADPVDVQSEEDEDEHVYEIQTRPRRETTDDDGAEEVFGHTFRWEPRTTLSLSEALNGADIATSRRDGWHERRAGTMAMGMAVGRGGPAGGMPMPVADAAEAELAPAAAPAPRPAKRARPRPTDGVASGMPAPPVAQQAPALRAGTTDDNAEFGDFLEFLATWTDRPGVAGNHVPMDVSDRRFVHVVDADGDPLPGARVSIIDRQADAVAWSGTTYGDGVAPFYPHLAGAESARGDWLVQAEHDGRVTTARWDGRSTSVELAVDSELDDGRVDLDVVFLIDTTGSMSDEIARIKSTLLSVTDQVRSLEDGVDLRYGAVLYRDIGDEYLTRHTPLTKDVGGFNEILQGIRAGGGGDGPESLNQGLSVAVSEMDWRDDAAKVVFLVADAPPHMDYQDDTTYADASLAALTQGIRIHTVAASGLDDFGSLVFRQSAQLGRGEFVFIEYGSAAASAADHGVTGHVASNNLDQILFEQLRDEVEGWGQRPDRVARR